MRIQLASPSRSGRIHASPVWRALEGGAPGRLEKLLSAFKDVPDTRKDKHLRCRACGRAIARTDDRICIQGSHEHTCTNPYGIVFHIGCFRAAPGGTEIGEETYEYTWFVGYRWQIMLCAQCKTHLGWSFHAHDGDRFCGLILDRLIAPK